MIKRLLILSVTILFHGVLPAQLQVKNYFSITGKKEVAVNAIHQDKLGFLWLGTNEGVFKFDGKRAFNISKEGSSLKQEITAIYVDQQQTVWIGTKSGKVFFYKNQKLDSLINPEFKNEEKITSFSEIDSAIFIGTYGNGLFILNRQLVRHYSIDNGLSDNVIYAISSDFKHTIWCCTDAGITEILNPKNKPAFSYISNKNGLPDNIVRDVTICENRLVISMQDSGACYYNLNTKQIEKQDFFTNWSHGTVLTAKSEIPPKLIIATERNGIITIVNSKVSVYEYEKNIQTNSINKVFIDNTNQIWIASKKGLSQLYARRYDFINNSKGLSDDKILALVTDNDNTIWSGTINGISKIVTNGEGKLVITKPKELEHFSTSCAAKSSDGTIWFGSYGAGIVIINPLNNAITKINTKNSKLVNDNISNIYFDKQNIIYISTFGGGLVKASYQVESKTFTVEKTYTENDGLGSGYIYACVTDNKGKLYVATDGSGIEVLENNQFISLTKKYNINSNTIFSICVDKYNTLWATSNANGIIKFNGNSFSSLGMADGLRDEQPQQLLSSDEIIYCINSKGIDKINCKTNEISYYDLFDGDLEPNLNAIYFDTKSFYSGTNNGVLIFRTQQESIDSLKPSAFIKSLQINYINFPLDSINEFKYNQNNMSFDFGGIWLKNPDKLSYRYKLDGLEINWSYSIEGKIANYNNLDAGRYTFIVQAKNEEDVWSNTATYSFTILSPIWKRWWFWVIVTILGSFAIYAFVKYRLKALQKENILLEQRVKERTFEIEKQSKIIAQKNIELEQLSLVASRTDNIVLILDAKGKLEYVNESFVRLNHLTLTELTQQYGETIYEISNHPDIKSIMNDAITNRHSVHYESLNRLATGQERWDSSTLTPIFDESGELKKIIIIDTDVTERKKQEQIIYQKNKDITDSISYARKIQYAILPDIELIKSYLPHSFILYMTKDIVSGDFYWFTHVNNSSIIAAVDCTGHGVPGAFMSLIGYNILNRIVNEQKITDPKDILYELNKGILEALYKNETESKDGMDIAICKINHKTHSVEYAGAMRPLWIVSKGELIEIKATKIPIGTRQQDRVEEICYTSHTIKANQGDTFYIFTDGYADQFGGEKCKKYSTARFKELILKNSSQNFILQENNLKLEHQQWKGNFEQVDDILVIGFTI